MTVLGNHYDLIIFDCDGTLVDSEYANNLALCQVLAEYNLSGYDLDFAYENWMGKTLTDIFTKLRSDHGDIFTTDIIKQCIARSNTLYETDLKIVPGALESVTTIASKYKICVASNGERQNVIRSLRLSGYPEKLFPETQIFSRIQVPKGKPAPDLFLHAALNMETEPRRCIVIEDSPTGVQAGVAAKMEVWGFTGVSHNPERQQEILKNSGASQVFYSLIHIAEALEA
jgi:HAD superfamily hydrolase (TIGR01509 family)